MMSSGTQRLNTTTSLSLAESYQRIGRQTRSLTSLKKATAFRQLSSSFIISGRTCGASVLARRFRVGISDSAAVRPAPVPIVVLAEGRCLSISVRSGPQIRAPKAICHAERFDDVANRSHRRYRKPRVTGTLGEQQGNTNATEIIAGPASL